jgi:hypothetical protein
LDGDGADDDVADPVSADALLDGVGLRRILVRLLRPGEPGFVAMGVLSDDDVLGGVGGVSIEVIGAGRCGSGCWIGPGLCDLGEGDTGCSAWAGSEGPALLDLGGI